MTMIPELENSASKVTAVERSKGVDEKSKLKLQKAVKDFEAMFVNYLLQNMRKTVQKSDEGEEGFGGDLMQGMFDLEISRYVARGSSLGIGEMLYRQMTGESLPKIPTKITSAVAPATAVASISSPELSREPIQKVASDPPAASSAYAGSESVVELAGRQASRQVTVSKPTPGPFTPIFTPPAVAASMPDHVKVARVASESTSTNLPKRLGQYENYIQQASDTFDISPNLLRAVIAAESSGNARALSSKNAKGVMQLIDSTATAMGVRDVWNPKENILGGARYLKQQLDRFNGDVKLAVASYNAGPAAVEKHGGVPPYNETRRYVEKVLKYLHVLDQNGEAGNEERR
jgi:soluble lytic murein transglycosylase-like protein